MSNKTKPAAVKSVSVKTLVEKIETLRGQKKGREFIKATIKKLDPTAIATLQARAKAKTLRGEDKVVVAWLFA